MPRDLARSRAVCREWKDTIDDRHLIRTEDLSALPLYVGGIFINFFPCCYMTEFFRPWRRAHDATHTLFSASSLFTSLPETCSFVRDHCNGLLLFETTVANPATGWWAPLPPWPVEGFCYLACIVFDPTVSSHYSVFVIDYASLYGGKMDPESEEAMAEVASELWPPSPYLFHVFSSRTGLWEERPFLHDGEAAGAIGDVGLGKPLRSTYWGQALYVLCSNGFILRISLSKDEYRVIKIPADAYVKSIAGYGDDSCLKVWVLNGSCHEHEWVLRHNKELRLELPLCYLNKQSCGPWILEDVNVRCDNPLPDDGDYNYVEGLKQGKALEEAAARVKFENWNSDDEDNSFLDTKDTFKASRHIGNLEILGFHPFKEILFLHARAEIAVAYSLNSSKFQYLGNIRPIPDLCYVPPVRFVDASFVYTPCRLEAYGNPGLKESKNG